MSEISTELIKEAVYNLCFTANTCLNKRIYNKIYEVYNSKDCVYKDIASDILNNAQTAYKTKLPLCQDTGMVIVFMEIGQEVQLKGEFVEDAINSAVEKCYKENFFRKSIVKDALFNRENTGTNTPVIIHSKIIKGDELKISVLIKGAGSENKTKLIMMLPTASEEELIQKCSEEIISAGENSCPPMFIGIGIGSSADNALIISKNALLQDDFSQNEKFLAEKIKNNVNLKAPEKYKNNYVLDVKVKTASSHIASMPVGITINCHSNRFSKCIIREKSTEYEHQIPDFVKIPEIREEIKEVFCKDTETIRGLKQGEKVFLTGEVYVARDMAHKRLIELIEQGKPLPIEIKNKIILYAGPCPNKPKEIIGSIGPTTAGRMDKYAAILYKIGLLATIGKGDRSKEIINIIKEKNSKYFKVTGGIAALLSGKVKSSTVIAFDDLGTEAIYKLEVEKFPVETAID